MDKIINIREPFYTAGNKFGWSGSPIGLGIKYSLLNDDGELSVTVGDKLDVWTIDKKVARDFVNKGNSFFRTARGNTTLGILPWSMFKKVVEAIKKKGPHQLSLLVE